MSKFAFTKRSALGLIFAVFAWTVLIWLGCEKQPQPITAPASESQQSGSLSKVADDINKVMAIQNRHTDALMAINGVVGTGTTALPNVSMP